MIDEVVALTDAKAAEELATTLQSKILLPVERCSAAADTQAVSQYSASTLAVAIRDGLSPQNPMQSGNALHTPLQSQELLPSQMPSSRGTRCLRNTSAVSRGLATTPKQSSKALRRSILPYVGHMFVLCTLNKLFSGSHSFLHLLHRKSAVSEKHKCSIK